MMKKIFSILSVAIFININAQVCFTSANYSVGISTEAIASADFNNDGKLDLAVAAYNQNGIYLLFGNGLGSFGASNLIVDSASSRGMVSADFNNDGNADLATIMYGNPGVVKIFFGNGTGNFPSRDSLIVGAYPFSICSADFNGDGKSDLATANSITPGTASVLLNNGTGSFTPRTDFFAGYAPVAVTSGDFNGDGKTDLAIASDNGGGPDSVSVLLGNGIGSFVTATSYLAGSGPYSVCSKDFNGDGFEDIAVANTNSNDVSILLSKGTSGAFFASTNYSAGVGSPFSVVSEDFNLDGKTDLAIGNYGANKATILLGTGTGSFSPFHNFAASYGPWTIISADFNSDGRPDLATANQSSSAVSVLLNVVAPHVNINVSNSAICAGMSTTLTVNGATTYTWSSNTGVSNANYTVTTAMVTPTTSNTYTVVGGKNGCKDSVTTSITVVTAAVPNICMVTTDSASNYAYNMIIWDKTLYSHVDSFIVYRYDVMSSTYLRIGSVSKNSLSEFKDTSFSIGGPNGGNPLYSSWLYKLAIRDTCGNIGAMSPYHQSMFVQESGATFSWNAYTVETGQANPVTGYSFLRDDNNNGNWHVLVNTAGLSTTDPNYANFPNGNWRVDALGFNCIPTMLMGGNNTQSITKKSHSNTSKPTAVDIKQFSSVEKIIIYPNPSSGNINIKSNAELGLITIYNTLGEIVSETKSKSNTEQIEIGNLSPGIYMIQVKGNYSKLIRE